MGLADTGRADQQNVGGGLDVAARAELGEEGTVDAGLGVVVEVLEGGRCRDRREPEAAGETACFGGVDLDGQEPFKRGGHRQSLGLRGVKHRGQRFGGGAEL